MNKFFRPIASLDSTTLPVDSANYFGFYSILTIGLLTGLGLEFCAYFSKLDKDVSQIVVYPFTLLLFLVCFRKLLPLPVALSAIATLPLLGASVYWTQGGVGIGGHSYISSTLVGSKNTLEQFRVDYNREAEIFNYPLLQTLYKDFSDNEARNWGNAREGLLIYAVDNSPRLRLFLGALQNGAAIKFDDFDLQVGLFPEWIDFDPQGIPVEYLEELARVVKDLHSELPLETKLDELSFAGFSAGIADGLWRNPVPRAAGLLLGASAKFALGGTEQNLRDLRCLQIQIQGSIDKIRFKESPELEAIAINNLGVLNLALISKRSLYSKGSLGSVQRQFTEAAGIRSNTGEIVEGAKLAQHNLFVLEAAGLTPDNLAG